MVVFRMYKPGYVMPFIFVYHMMRYCYHGFIACSKQVYHFFHMIFLGFDVLWYYIVRGCSTIFTGWIPTKPKTKKLKQPTSKNTDMFLDHSVSFSKEPSSLEKVKQFLTTDLSFHKTGANKKILKREKTPDDLNLELLEEEKNAGENKNRSSEVKEKILYEYVAKDKHGKQVKGYFEAFNKMEVRSFLINEGLEVYSIRTNRWITLLHKDTASGNVKIKTKDLVFFLTQLSTYIKAGIPLAESLEILSRQFKNKHYQRIMKSLVYDLNLGVSFSEAMEKQGKAFPRLLINMVRASEMTGSLPEVLDDQAVYFDEMEQTRKQMITAMMYPSIVFIIALGVLTFVMLFVVPQFVDIFESMDASAIPGITLFIMNMSGFMKDYIIWIMISIVILILVMRYLYQNVTGVRRFIQIVLMHIPVFGNVIIYNEVTMFTKTFSSLMAHNVFITDTMKILKKITNNEIYKELINDTIRNLATGERISLAFKDHWAFPVPAYEMLVTGERTGELPEMMEKVSAYYQDLHKNAVARIKIFIEPLLIVMLTAMVGLIVLSIVIPMFKMYGAIQGA